MRTRRISCNTHRHLLTSPYTSHRPRIQPAASQASTVVIKRSLTGTSKLSALAQSMPQLATQHIDLFLKASRRPIKPLRNVR